MVGKNERNRLFEGDGKSVIYYRGVTLHMCNMLHLSIVSYSLQALAKEMGALSRNFGFGLEDIAHVVIPGYLKRHYKIDMVKG